MAKPNDELRPIRRAPSAWVRWLHALIALVLTLGPGGLERAHVGASHGHTQLVSHARVAASGQQDVTLRNFALQLVPELASATEEPQKTQFTLVEPSYRRTGFAGHTSTVRLHLPQPSPFRLRLQLQGETLWQTQGDLAAGQHEFSHALPPLPQGLPSSIGDCRWQLELDGLDLEQHFQLCSGGPPRIDVSAGKLRQDQQPLFLVGNYIRQDNLQEAQELGLKLSPA